MNVGAKMQSLRKEAKMTTTELANQVGMSQAQISRLENGVQGFRLNTLKKISEALEVDISYFFTDAEIKHPWLSDAIEDEKFAQAAEKLNNLRKNNLDKFNELVESIVNA